MRTPRPPFVKGEYYHFYNRGAHRASIFREPSNFLFVIRKIKHYTQKLSLAPIACCLMPNHFHFLIRQDGDQPAGLLPQLVFNSYVKAYNKMYQHNGTLFEGHFHAKHIQNYKHLIHLCRYIHGNPVKDGLTAAPEEWPYSNYLEWIGQRDGTLMDSAFIHDHFSSAQEYADFVMGYLKSRQLPDEVRVYLDSIES